jgi:N-methylhydantoinase B
VGTSNITERVANAVQMAMATLGEGIGMAEVGGAAPACGVISGVHPETGQPYIDSITLGFTGGAASATSDAWQSIGALGGGGQAFQDSIELTELYQPIEVAARYMLPDTEGAGRFRGASSLYVEFGPSSEAFEFGFISDGLINAAKGARGGLAGGQARQFRRKADGALEPLQACGQAVIEKGERLVAITSGGGGYGDPHARDRAALEKDIAEGWISLDRARAVYGLGEDQ